MQFREMENLRQTHSKARITNTVLAVGKVPIFTVTAVEAEQVYWR